MSKREFDVDELLGGLFPKESLSDIFEKRLKELDMLPTQSLDILGIEYRALQGFLNGSKKMIDATNIFRLANFLKMPRDKVASLFLDALEKNFSDSDYPQSKIDFIKANFDLAALRKAGFINSITHYRNIENQINRRFGYASIFEYKPVNKGIAFSSGMIQPKNLQSRQVWIKNAIERFERLNNPYPYDRDRLIKYIPSIRWQCTNVSEGLHYVISDLYRLGVSVLYQSPLSNLHIRGATLVINEKPCIVLTNYRNFYPTLWFALIHEIYHTLFDLDEIKTNVYHVSDDDAKDLALKEKENKADCFARDYLFSKDKLAAVRPHINNSSFVNTFAEKNQIHPSFIYLFYAYDSGNDDTKAWQRAQKYNPPFDELIDMLDLKWTDEISIDENIKALKNTQIYN
ncbi:ImmA/IrrE family metallo-endopeptidase [Pararcticibacter amylolyticus]|uniref:IrrE N-terminal-like domain-containing protein n=1 Tax=Pararcticibacter amylolyticus TaxID=2173175 RepID=A0A2U2P9N7_9SPHI|nr:hypothetical protein [Pararcticibacter amylolyticus]PWG78055.1 hypothetical protein DDR33_24255 [Pararcticibacter amylolyticus]